MTKPRHIWLTLSVCALVIVAAMGWLTSHILDLERERARAVEESELQSRVRLALSSMDTAASSILVIENQRPPNHFRAFYNPGDVYDNDFNNFDQSLVLQPSPLATELPEFVNLHFEIQPGGAVRSPQVPSVDDGIWGQILAPSEKVLGSARANLEDLRKLLDAPAEPGSQAAFSNGAMMCAAVHDVPGEVEPVPTSEAPKGAWVADQVLNSTAQERIQSPSYQQEFSKVERGNRKRVFEQAVRKAAEESSAVGSNTLKVKSRGVQAGSVDSFADVLPQEPKMPEVAQAASEGVDEPPAEDAGESQVSPFRVLWLAGELFAVRRVEFDGQVRFQGVWFDADGLRDYLLEAVAHLLPEATLEPIVVAGDSLTNGARRLALRTLQDDPLALVTVPWRLRPGEMIKSPGFHLTQVHLALGVGWVAVLFSLLAAAVLVRGVLKLSERRASFVSSVTHELRTPLTTFQLYSDLLAEGMITDPGKQKAYLETLRKEAGRLNHLIENVLAYSRIERGSAKSRKESLTVGELVARLRPRLEDRVKSEQVALTVELDVGLADRRLFTDPGAVEQILFNLVDNACKYGRGNDGDCAISVRATARHKDVRIAVCDKGDGIARSDRRRLFKPFQKSSRDESDTKPGVGLGLSLCRRLARALGGDLKLSSSGARGACFVLDLPGD